MREIIGALASAHLLVEFIQPAVGLMQPPTIRMSRRTHVSPTRMQFNSVRKGRALQHFYLRYAVSEAHGCVLVADGKPLRFRSRQAALSFIVRRCYEEGATEGEPVINIQGSDGRWRAFDCRLLPTNEATLNGLPERSELLH